MLGWKRALADYDNLKKDLSKERVEMRRDATIRAAQSFLAVLDNFDAAVKFQPDISALSRAERGTSEDPSPLAQENTGAERGTSGDPWSDADLGKRMASWLSGILFIRTQLETALRDLGLEPFGNVGDAFDANLHEAVDSRHCEEPQAMKQSPDSSGTILEVVRRGWKMGDKVVRSASVIVSK